MAARAVGRRRGWRRGCRGSHLDKVRDHVEDLAEAVLQVVRGHAHLHRHADRDQLLGHVDAAGIGGEHARGDEHEDERRDKGAVEDDARPLLNARLVLHGHVVVLGLLLLHREGAHRAQLLDHLVRVGHHVLRHLARSVVHPLHHLRGAGGGRGGGGGGGGGAVVRVLQRTGAGGAGRGCRGGAGGVQGGCRGGAGGAGWLQGALMK